MNSIDHLPDAGQRQAATDPARSFIVQAPAGSGKTELLTQRYLRLLARVDNPRQVLAITFTRKATQEMAARVRTRLQAAARGTAPAEAHQRLGWELAAAVVERDRALGWQLLDNPEQLQIQTIDGLCARLAMLGASEAGAMPPARVLDDARLLYAEAAQRTLEYAARLDEPDAASRRALEGLLPRLHGNALRLCELLADALGRRDQWLGNVLDSGVGRAQLLAACQQQEWLALRDALGGSQLDAVIAAVNELEDEIVAAPRRDIGITLEAAWRSLSALASSSGMPYKSASISRYVFADAGPQAEPQREVFRAAVAAWHDDAAALRAFSRFVKTPPLDLQPGDAEVLSAMRALLVHASLELRVLFAEQGACDFPHVSSLALEALGHDLDPGRALMIEDGRLQHVLVDEFQDTSHSQYALLSGLTQGWMPGDGRTLFLVGDPMQSIYRFRKAEVALFSKVFEAGGLGTVALEPLRLVSNFRSRREVVEFVNTALPAVFSAPSPLAAGAVDYVPFAARQPAGGQVGLHPAPPGADEHEEAARIAGAIQQALQREPDTTIAVLGRAKRHLEPVALALAEQGIAFEAVEIQGLKTRQVVQDLLSLTRALLHPADRIAWLALLHAPWCGLDAQGLLLIAGDRFDLDPLVRMNDAELLEGLPTGLAASVRQLGQVMSEAVAAAPQVGLRRRVESAWVRLGGPLVVETAQDLEDAQAFLELLSQVEAEQPQDLAGELAHRVERLFAGARRANVQLMTIHKAKGLEFDVVVLPRMEQATGRGNQELFRQQDVAPPGSLGSALLAPVASADQPSLYAWLGLLEDEAQACEAQRVLYVALTRARRELHLFGRWSAPKTRGPSAPKGSFMDMLWPAFAPLVAEQDATEAADSAGSVVTWPMLVAPALPPLTVAPELPFLQEAAPLPRPRDVDAMALGGAFHRWLELIHDHWEESWLGDWYAGRRAALESSLRQAGAGEDALPGLYERLCELLRKALANDSVRAWLSGAVGGSVSEAVFYRRDGFRLQRQIIDLLRPDGQGGWEIVDWKTSAATAAEEWAVQLKRYADCVRESGLGEVAALSVFQPDSGQVTVLQVGTLPN